MTSNASDNRRLTPIGQLGPFDLLEFLGKGAMGQVWRARHAEQDVPCAIKVVTEARARHDEYQRQLRQEVRAVAGLSHPGIVMVFDYGSVTPQVEQATLNELRAHSPYLAMELCPRGSLADIRRQLSFASIRSILLSLLDALAHAHARGVIHRDIKPANILLGDDTDWTGVKLTDFGLAFVAERVEDATSRGACGTPAFMSPEQFQGRWRDVGPWTDLYSLGCLAYYLACGEPVYPGKSIVSVAKKHLRTPVPRLQPRIPVPDEFEGWVRRLLQKDPLGRYRNAADAAWSLLLMNPPAEASPTSVDAEYGFDTRSSTLVLKPFDKILKSTGPGRELRSSAPKLDEHSAPPARGDDAPLIDVATAPLSSTWQHLVGRRRSIQLLGAGLGLYGLRHVPLVGREDERDTLWNTLCQAAEAKSPRAALVRGPSGVGKSFLAEWLCERAEESGAALTLKATHGPNPGGSEGLPRMLARYFRAAGLERASLTQRLCKWFRARGVVDAYEWDALTEMLSPATAADVEAGQRKLQFARSQQRYALIARVLELIARERAVVLWLDDLQWSPDSLGFLRFCLDSNLCADIPMMVLGTIRDEALSDESSASSQIADFAVDERITHVSLGPLSRYDHADFIEKLLYLAPALARRVADRTGGNPLFAVQLVGDWVDRGVLEVGEEGFVLADGEQAPIPDDIFEVWSSRLDEVLADADADADTMCALELAAVLGMEVDGDEWRTCLVQAGWAYPEPAVQALLQHRLLEDTDTGLRFAHGMLRESLERRAKQHERLVDHHRTCAEMLQARHDDQPQLAERLGRHLLAAHAYDDALAPLLAGARARGNAGDFAATQTLLDLHLDAIEALELPAICAPRAKNDMFRATVLAVQKHHDEAIALAQRTVQIAESLGDGQLLADALFRRGKCFQQHGYYSAALKDMEEARNRLPESDEFEELSRDVLDSIANILQRLGRFDEAIELLEQCLETPSPVRRLSRYYLIGDCERRRGNLAIARQYFATALELNERIGPNVWSAPLLLAFGELARMENDFDEATRIYREIMEQTAKHYPAKSAVAKLNLALAHIQRRDFAAARPLLAEVRDDFERANRQLMLLYVKAFELVLLSDLGRWQDVRRNATEAMQAIQEQGIFDPDLAIPFELAGEMALKAGRWEQGREILQFAVEQWKGVQNDERASAARRKLQKEPVDAPQRK